MKTSFWTKFLDLFSPRRCGGCGRRLSAEEAVLCPACRLHLRTTGFHLAPADNPMARLFWGQVALERAAAYFFYEPKTLSGRLIHHIKYHGRDDLAETLGQMMAQELLSSGFFEGIGAIVAVPLSRNRRWQRGYNQSHHIALGISRATGLPIVPRALRRIRFDQSQTHVDPEQRRQNVEGAFRLGRRAQELRGRHVLLVDDVVTTGATTISCARELLQVEGVSISIVALGFTRS